MADVCQSQEQKICLAVIIELRKRPASLSAVPAPDCADKDVFSPATVAAVSKTGKSRLLGTGIAYRALGWGTKIMRQRSVHSSIGARWRACIHGRRPSGFTLIEMLGVLSVIAILASVLVPRVFEAIHKSRISHATLALHAVKTASVEHAAKFGRLESDGSVNPVSQILLDGSDRRADEFDLLLIKEALLDNPFEVKFGAGYIELAAALGPNTDPDGANSAYDLDNGGAHNDATSKAVAQAVVVGVTLEDARALNNAIDGPGLGEDNGGNDFRGRVKYAKATQGNGNGNGKANGKGNRKANAKGGNTGTRKAWAWGQQRDGTLVVFVYLTHH